MSVEPTREKILIIDDNPTNIWPVIEYLEKDYEFSYATGGEQALKIAFSDNRPDLILLDIMMPGMDGYEVCSKLKENQDTRSIPVIFITALGQDKDETKGLDLGAVDFIQKPFSMPIVTARIKAALRLKAEMDHRAILAKKLEDLNKNLENRVHEKTFQLKQAHENLKASERMYRTIFENAIEGIFQATPGGRIISASPSLAAMLGYSSVQETIDTITNTAIQLFLRPGDRAEMTRNLDRSGMVIGYETQFKKKDGAVIWVNISARVVLDEATGSPFYQGFCVDVTEQRRAKELEMANLRLQELDVLKSALISTASHDIRSPLASILGYTQLVKMDLEAFMGSHILVDESLKKRVQKNVHHLETVEREVDRLTRLVNDFLDLSKYESGCFDWNEQLIRITDLIDEAVESARGQLLTKPGVVLKTIYDDERPYIYCDPDRIMQVLVNLLSNATKYTESGSVTVYMRVKGNEFIEVGVSDNGPGIPEDEKDNIFDKFYQIKRVREPKGTGLGLAISKMIIEHYNGKIWVESEPGHGSTFIFQVPMIKRGQPKKDLDKNRV